MKRAERRTGPQDRRHDADRYRRQRLRNISRNPERRSIFGPHAVDRRRA
jgi:hypothetical protein